MRTVVSVNPKETSKDVRIIIAEVFRDDAHLEVRAVGEKMSGKVEARLNLIVPHAYVEDPAKGTLERPHRHSELGRNPGHPKLYMAVVEGDHIMRKERGTREFGGDIAC